MHLRILPKLQGEYRKEDVKKKKKWQVQISVMQYYIISI